jgi:hypothetical protein
MKVRSTRFRMFKKAVQRGRSERRGEAYSVLYVEPLSDATCLREALRRRQGTKLADFFNILPPPLTLFQPRC